MVQGDAKALIRLVVSGAVSGTKTRKNWKKMNVSSCSKKKKKSQKAKDSQMTLMVIRWVICSGSKTWCAGRTEQQQNIREHGLCRAPLNGCQQINQEIHFLVQSKWKRKNNQYFSGVKKKKIPEKLLWRKPDLTVCEQLLFSVLVSHLALAFRLLKDWRTFRYFKLHLFDAWSMTFLREPVLQYLSFSFKACQAHSKHIQNHARLIYFADPFSTLSQDSYRQHSALLLE